MKRRHHPDTTHLVPLPAELADWSLHLEHRLHREGAEPDDDLRPYDLDLPQHVRLARRNLVWLRVSIFRRAALDNVADVHVGAREAHAALDDVGEELTRAADERLALRVFIGSRAFADKHQLRIGVADAEDQIFSERGELAALAVADEFAKLLERRGCLESRIHREHPGCCRRGPRLRARPTRLGCCDARRPWRFHARRFARGASFTR